MIGIISAMPIEIEKIKNTITNPEQITISGFDFIKGKIHDKDVVVVVCGIGKVFAAICTQTMILKFLPSIIINVGVAGALSKTLTIGDIAIAENVVQYDMDISPLGYPVGLIHGIDMIKISADSETTKLIQTCTEEMKIYSEIGTIASGDKFLNDVVYKKLIVEMFQAIACEMESASIGQVCYVNKVEFAVIRIISDDANEESHIDFNMNLVKITDKLAEVVDLVLLNY